jgi:alkylation response protein AidB-like acyl-CoA dehydrogenase
MGRQWSSARKLLQPERLASKTAHSELFDLSIDEEQQLVRDMAQRFAREVMREAAAQADAACAAPDGFAEQFAELGLAQLAVPEALGGAASEASSVTQVLAAEDLAHGDMGLALCALAPVSVANVLARFGSADQQARYLPAFAADKPPAAALAIAERRAAFDPRLLSTRARANGGGFILDGEKTLVPLCSSAELLVVAADLVGRGPQLFLVERGTAGVEVKPQPAMGLRAAGLGALVLRDVHLPPGALVGEEAGAVDYAQVLDRCALGWAALALGTSQAMLDYVIPYCNDRKAFGEPISHRQAVAFMIANIAIELDGMRLLTGRAASRADRGLPFQREAFLARLMCAEKGMAIGTDGVQLLGGHGFTKEHPVERFYRDLRAIGVMEGGVML